MTTATTAIATVKAHADPEWYSLALQAAKDCALSIDRFTSDDVWNLLEFMGAPTPHEPRAMGAVLKDLADMGRITATGEWKSSKRRACHNRPVMVWRATP